MAAATIVVEARHTHPYGFRSGQWAEIKAIVPGPDRQCYLIEFPDGVTDFWPVGDPSGSLEFRRTVTPEED